MRLSPLSAVPRAALALALLALGACARAVAPGSAPHADRLDIAMSGNPNTLDPVLTTQQFEVQAESLALDPLVATDPDGRDVPVLAARVPTPENGDVSRDGRTITYRLRRGVVWQDGAPFTSRDVAFTWRAIMNPRTNVATRHGYDRIASVGTPDPYTAVFRLERPFAPAVHTFFAHSDSPVEIMPAHLLERYRDLNAVPFNSLPVGTGPFRVVRWIRGDRIEYARNDRYFLGRPKIARVVLHFVPDENTIVNQMRSHQVDWFVQASPRVFPQLDGIPGVAMNLVPFNGFDSMIFNTRRAPFSDARLRRAVGLAIDKPRLVREVTFGTALPATEDLPASQWAFDPDAGTARPDLARARRLLADAGWTPGADGVRTRAGRRLAMGLAYRSDSLTDRNRGVVIASMLRAAGIDVELKGYTTALLYGAAEAGGILASGKYDAGLETWYSGVDPDDSGQLDCDQIPPGGGNNWSRFCDRELDRAEADALSHYDRPTRKRAYARVEAILARSAPEVYLWWPRQIDAVDSRLRGFRPNGIVDDWNAWSWSFASGG